jgi:membrane-bound lytic murein transglycosylase F
MGHKFIMFLFLSTMTLSCSGDLTLLRFINYTGMSACVKKEQNLDSLITSVRISDIEAIRKYLPVLKKYSRIYKFDWRLILAVIRQESNFNHKALSPKGAFGLLQIMPETGREIVRSVSHIRDYRSPRENIIAGLHYLWIQYNRFSNGRIDRTDCLKLALAAYNAGPGRIIDAQRIAQYLNEDPDSWETIKMVLPLLSRRYYTLHRYIWEDGKPPSGYFENHRETTNYVDKIFRYYEEYKKIFPESSDRFKVSSASR